MTDLEISAKPVKNRISMTVTGWMTGEGKRSIRVATIVNATLSHGGPGSGEIFHTNNKEIKKVAKIHASTFWQK